MWPSSEVVTGWCKLLGLKLDDEIVIYDQPSGTLGSYWTLFVLRAYGYLNVKILVGGIAQWFAKGFDVVPG